MLTTEQILRFLHNDPYNPYNEVDADGNILPNESMLLKNNLVLSEMQLRRIIRETIATLLTNYQ